MPRLKALDRFYPWFYRILRNRCFNLLDHRRTRERYARQSIVVKETEASPGQLLEERDQRERVWLPLAKLKPYLGEILTLKYLHDFSYAEIPETLGIPRGL